MSQRINLLDSPADPAVGEQVEEILRRDRVRLERIVSRGHASPAGFWYDQDENEWVTVLAGAAGLRFADREEVLVLRPGDHVDIPAHVRHRVEWTSDDEDTIWLAMFYR